MIWVYTFKLIGLGRLRTHPIYCIPLDRLHTHLNKLYTFKLVRLDGDDMGREWSIFFAEMNGRGDLSVPLVPIGRGVRGSD